MALYAAYGSNMDPSHMLQRCPSSPVAGTGWLPDWRLTFGGEDLGWDGALAMVVEDPESAVFVVLYDMADSDERTLDSWEGADLGLYSKIRLRVQTLDGDVLAWLYALQAFEGGLPSARYIGVIADAAEAAGYVFMDAAPELQRDLGWLYRHVARGETPESIAAADLPGPSDHGEAVARAIRRMARRVGLAHVR